MNVRNSNNKHAPAEIVQREEDTYSEPEVTSPISELRPTKKMVHFHNNDVFHRMDSPMASDMTTQEKYFIWYHSDDFNQFKYEAARHAGVKISRNDSDMPSRNDQFIMMGDFDSKDGKVDIMADLAAKDGNKASAVEYYYNENEYKDSTDEHGAICKRGLGYHFSCNRKKSRAVTRSAVMTWQKALHDNPYNQSIGFHSKLQKDLPKAISKSQAMIALVSTKCSRIARAEAQWRGSVDYRVAYPDHHDSSLNSSSIGHPKRIVHVKKIVTTSDDSEGANKRRLVDVAMTMNACHQRRRCDTNRVDLSPSAVGYLNGLLPAEVCKSSEKREFLE